MIDAGAKKSDANVAIGLVRTIGSVEPNDALVGPTAVPAHAEAFPLLEVDRQYCGCALLLSLTSNVECRNDKDAAAARRPPTA